jgi:hypothetical protein
MSRHKKTQKQLDLGGEDIVAQAEAEQSTSPRQAEPDTSFRQRRTARLNTSTLPPISWTDAFDKYLNEVKTQEKKDS